MVASPRPYDYVNYVYTPQGKHYELWAFKVPIYCTNALLLLAGTTASVALGRLRLWRQVVAVWCLTVLFGVVFLAITAYHYAIAVNFFI